MKGKVVYLDELFSLNLLYMTPEAVNIIEGMRRTNWYKITTGK